jgi:DNA modification methylase
MHLKGLKQRPDDPNTYNGGDEGSASRYYKKCPLEEGEYKPLFYSGKASQRERNQGLDGFEEKENNSKYGEGFNSATKLVTEKQIKDGYVERSKVKNVHPTVKPISLMEYLVKLTKQPEGNLVLDPFMGSGTTGIACKKQGIEFVGIEKEQEYFEIAKARIENYSDKYTPDQIFKPKNKEKIQMELFNA